MDLNAYHNALNQGFSEREATRIGDDAYEDAQFMNRKHQESDHAEQAQRFFEEMERERIEWQLGDYDNGDSGCPNCGRSRLCICANGKHRCEKCNWSPELNGYAPIW